MTLLDIVEKVIPGGAEELAQAIRDSGGIGYRELQTLVADLHRMIGDRDIVKLKHALRLGLDPAAYIEVGGESNSLLDASFASGDTLIARLMLESTDLDYWSLYNIFDQLIREERREMLDVTIRHSPGSALIYGMDVGEQLIIDSAFRYLDPEQVEQFAPRDVGTPLHQAVAMGDADVVQALVDLGVSVNARDREGNTALHEAARQENVFMAGLLLDLGADIEAVNEYGETPLFTASREETMDILPFLIERGARVDITDRWGNNPLHFLASMGRISEVVLLLEEGADREERNIWGETPRDIADERGDSPLVRILDDKSGGS
jgi:hypothetical protein